MDGMRLWNWGLIGCALVLLVVAVGVPHANGEVVEIDSEIFANLSGIVYVDIDNSGTYDSSENKIRDVLIILDGLLDPIDPNSPEAEAWGVGLRPLAPGEKETHQRIAWTNSQGSYRFDNLLPGTYSVIEVTPYMFVEGKANAPGKIDGQVVGQAVTSNRFANVVVPPIGEGVGYNFGEWGLRTKYLSKTILIVPEPSTATLMFGVFFFLGLYWRHRR